ncbi:hypothetical protein C1645_838059 [Glomus cerebriforme]|uniref:Uncharacterized protein n=1 Tax=Glomus cerebriforme TaxID=658196 RepID=A0A397S7N4_9GLOM|nr:hypothetical protein C1645_838059 [Glomus cerebriforme]
MHINGYTVELLINDVPLKEFIISTADLETSTTGKSFVYNETSKKRESLSYSHFALVPKIPSNYVIKVSSDNVSKKKPMLAYIYVDGVNDSTSLRLITDSPSYKDGFKSKNRQYKHNFQFNTSSFTKSSKNNNGLGSVSVYFYKARILSNHIGIKDRKDTLNYDNFLDRKFPFTCQDIGVMTKFGSGVSYKQPKNLMKTIKPLIKFGNSPIAVLHLHYRPYEWFVKKNICGFNGIISHHKFFGRKWANNEKDDDESNIKKKIPINKDNDQITSSVIKKEEIAIIDPSLIKKEDDSTLLSNIKKKKNYNNSTIPSSKKKKKEDVSSSIVTIKKEDSMIIKEENVKIEDKNLGVVKQEKEFQSQNSINLGKRKRKCKYRTVIEILDSDDEDRDIICLD